MKTCKPCIFFHDDRCKNRPPTVFLIGMIPDVDDTDPLNPISFETANTVTLFPERSEDSDACGAFLDRAGNTYTPLEQT